MNPNKFFIGRTVVIIIILVIVGIVIGFYSFNNYIYQEKQVDNSTYAPYRGTLTGVQTCLPHKDTSGPQTMECAIGMKTDSGEYYALDFSVMSQIPIEVQTGQGFSANGLITPIENLSTDYWQKYNVKGIFSVTDSVKVE